MTLRLLFLGDIVGHPGRMAVRKLLPDLRRRHRADLVLANVENAAGGFGITGPVAEELHTAGVDLMTSGNHIWDKREAYDFIDTCPYLVRPANYPKDSPGRGALVYTDWKHPVGLINLSGRVFLDPLDDPFRTASELVAELRRSTPLILVDIHAEATAEKVALGWHLAGAVSAVVGTHTHVLTADARVLPGGTAYITDLGMCGPRDSVLGMERDIIIQRFQTQMPVRFAVADGPAVVCGVSMELDTATGHARRIQAFQEICEDCR